MKSVDVNDRGQSQLQQQEEVIYTERNTLKQMDVWAETLGNVAVCLLIQGKEQAGMRVTGIFFFIATIINNITLSICS